MRWKRAAFLFVAVSSIAATGVAPTKSELSAFYEKAERELAAGDFAAALKVIDAIDARQPGLAAVENFRGVVWMREGKYERAEGALRKALEIDPGLWQARFNLADLPFLRKEWAQAGERFAALREALPADLKATITPLLDYKILLTHLFANEEEKAGVILNKLQGWEKSPAFDYAEAAILFHRGKRAEGKHWMAAAEKAFSAEENKIFRESFYEAGWLPRPAGEPPVFAEFTSAEEMAANSRAETQVNFEQAKRAFEARDFAGALSFLDRTNEPSPEEARLRAEILLEQKKFDQAEATLSRATSAQPAGWETEYLLARIALGRKQYADARERLQALLSGKSGPLQPEATQLVRYQMFVALLLDGQEAAAQQMMDQFKFTDQTPALYYAQAAWSLEHDNPKQARQWAASAEKIFPQEANAPFAGTLLELGAPGGRATGKIAGSSPEPVSPSPLPSSPAPAAAAAAASSATPASTPIAAATASSPAVSPSVEVEAPTETAGKTEKRQQAKRKKSPTRKRKSRQADSSPAAARPAATAVPLPRPTPTPRPPLVDRVVRTLLHPFKSGNPKGAGDEPTPSPKAAPARPAESPREGRQP